MTCYKLLRPFLHSKSCKQVWIIVNKQTNKMSVNLDRNLHNSFNLCARAHMEHGNNYAYSVMENKGYTMKLNFVEEKKTLCNYSLQQLVNQDWSQKTPKYIFDTLPILGELCSEQKLCISDKIFDNFIDHLTDNLVNASDTELKSIFYSLLKWPPVQFSRMRNFIEVWVALEDECLKRYKDWTYDEMFTILTFFYFLNIIRISDFPHKCLLKLASKAKHFTPAQLVQTMFFIGVRMYAPDDMHNLEIHITNNFYKFTIDELAVISMGFYKSKTPIRNMDLVENIIDQIVKNSTHIHETTLLALMMIIHYSMKFPTGDSIYKLLEKLQFEVRRLSILCNVYMGLLGTSSLTLHEGCLDAIANRVSTSIKDTRIKDLERLILAFGIFCYKPKCNDIFLKITDELKRPEREVECTLHGRSFACCVAYLCMLGIYDKELLKKTLDPMFLEKTYGKYCITYSKEILILHNIAKIFYKNDNISTLSNKEAIILARKYSNYVPDENFKKQYNITERLYLEVFNILKESRGSDYITGGHVLTHHQRGDIILCNDSKGSAVPVGDAFHNKNFGLLRTPPDNNKWIVLIIGGKNALIQNTGKPCGQFYSKIRELNALGFCAELVTLNALAKCETQEAKLDYLNYLINEAVKQMEHK